MLGEVQGVGGTAQVQKSCNGIKIIMDGQLANLYVTITPLPEGVQALVGRDVLNQYGVVLTSEKTFQ